MYFPDYTDQFGRRGIFGIRSGAPGTVVRQAPSFYTTPGPTFEQQYQAPRIAPQHAYVPPMLDSSPVQAPQFQQRHAPIAGGSHPMDWAATGNRNIEFGTKMQQQAFDPSYHPPPSNHISAENQGANGFSDWDIRQTYRHLKDFYSKPGVDPSGFEAAFNERVARYGVNGSAWIRGNIDPQTHGIKTMAPGPMVEHAPAPVVDAPYPSGARTAKLPNGQVGMLDQHGGQVGPPMMQQSPTAPTFSPGPQVPYGSTAPINRDFLLKPTPDIMARQITPTSSPADDEQTRRMNATIPYARIRDQAQAPIPESQLRQNRYDEGANLIGAGQDKIAAAPPSEQQQFDAYNENVRALAQGRGGYGSNSVEAATVRQDTEKMKQEALTKRQDAGNKARADQQAKQPQAAMDLATAKLKAQGQWKGDANDLALMQFIYKYHKPATPEEAAGNFARLKDFIAQDQQKRGPSTQPSVAQAAPATQPSAGAGDVQVGATAVNRQTGKRVRFNGTDWEEIQ